MKMLGGTNQRALLRAIIPHIAAAVGQDRDLPRVIVESIESVDWASLTFTGQRHRTELRVDLAAPLSAGEIAALAATFATAEFTLPRQIVAEIALAGHSAGVGSEGCFPLLLSVDALIIDD